MSTNLLLILSIILGGVNLGFVLKILYNDLHYLKEQLDDHIKYHLEHRGD